MMASCVMRARRAVMGAPRLRAAALAVACLCTLTAPIAAPRAHHPAAPAAALLSHDAATLFASDDGRALPADVLGAAPAPMPTRRRQLRAGSGSTKRDAGDTGEQTVVIVQYWEDFGNPPFEVGDGGGGDFLCLVAFFALCAVAILSVLAIMCDPWWPPFEERGPGLMCMMSLSAVVWSWATLVVDDHAPEWMHFSALTAGPDGTATAKFWLVWIRMIAGCGAFIGCMFVRLHAVNALYIVKDQAEPAWWLTRLAKYVSPWVVLAVLRLYILKTAMNAVAAWTINLGMGFAHMCLLVWQVASIDRKRVRRNGIGDVNITMSV